MRCLDEQNSSTTQQMKTFAVCAITGQADSSYQACTGLDPVGVSAHLLCHNCYDSVTHVCLETVYHTQLQSTSPLSACEASCEAWSPAYLGNRKLLVW